MAEAYTITKQYHEKKDIDIYVVRLIEKVDTDIFDELKSLAKSNHGYYSSFRGVNGFVFKSEDDAESFVSEMSDLIGIETLDSTSLVEEDHIKPVKKNKAKSKVEPKSHMPLHEALRYIVDTEGVGILNDTRLVNILDDLHAYEELPSAKYILRAIITDNYMQKFITIGGWNNDALSYSSKISSSTGFILEHINWIFKSIAFALNWITKWDVPSSSNSQGKAHTSNPRPITLAKWSKKMDEDETDEFFKSITEYDKDSEKGKNVVVGNIAFYIDIVDRCCMSCEMTLNKKLKAYTAISLHLIVYDSKGRIRDDVQVGYFGDKEIGTKPAIATICGLKPASIGALKLYWK